MNEVADPNMFKATLFMHLKANMSKFQISPKYGLNAFRVPIIIIVVVVGWLEELLGATKSRKTQWEDFSATNLVVEGQDHTQSILSVFVRGVVAFVTAADSHRGAVGQVAL